MDSDQLKIERMNYHHTLIKVFGNAFAASLAACLIAFVTVIIKAESGEVRAGSFILILGVLVIAIVFGYSMRRNITRLNALTSRKDGL